MDNSETTCWTLIEDAAAGDARQRDLFARRYMPVVCSYVIARWNKMGVQLDVDDACQEIFAECFRPGGPIQRADRECAGGFRAFLFGVSRNILRRIETKHWKGVNKHGMGLDVNLLDADETSMSRLFDRAWAVGILREAAQRQGEIAGTKGENAVRRVELLRLRFREEIPIRDIAKQWHFDPTKLHREYRTAKREFLRALREVVVAHDPAASAGEVDRNCQELLDLLA